ncbi:hypothetical protein LTR37_011518 [Vermiconidia calcicola]|uniref:Uncharacterized protein n=1 Tax=Vermiconidia calcicola TaxID=1690605 RepID=A0ACC3N2A9_9PEZI|nr:hypothetical protein LTR37_011518 [Vermiconidia calcicola]
MATLHTLLRVAPNVFATMFVGFGVNYILSPQSALTFFELDYPTLSTSQKQTTDALLAVIGVRDIFMGLAIYAVAYFGTPKALGWITVAAAGVAGADGLVCKVFPGSGEWNHWGYAPMVAVVGLLLALR